MNIAATITKAIGAAMFILFAVAGHGFESTAVAPKHWELAWFDAWAIAALVPNSVLSRNRMLAMSYVCLMTMASIANFVIESIAEQYHTAEIMMFYLAITLITWLPALSMIIVLNRNSDRTIGLSVFRTRGTPLAGQESRRSPKSAHP